MFRSLWLIAGLLAAGIPAVVRESDVVFPHAMHFEDLGIECATCHHETDAGRLVIPHPEYFDTTWVDCEICHRPQDAPTPAMACSTCHHDSPTSIADQTLSAKVVIHRSCWSCHEVGQGAEASATCATCHLGEEAP